MKIEGNRSTGDERSKRDIYPDRRHEIQWKSGTTGYEIFLENWDTGDSKYREILYRLQINERECREDRAIGGQEK
jgi:hypothetical protein